jgi:hypothetical protein
VGRVAISVDGSEDYFEGAVSSWENVRLIEGIRLDAGLHLIIVKAVDQPVSLEWLEVLPEGLT